MPTPSQLALLLNQGSYTAEARFSAVLGIVSTLAKSYTRGHGWTDGQPAEDIDAVILTAAARLVTNPGQISAAEGMGGLTVDWRAGFTGWTLVELAVLNRYRDMAV